MHTTSSHRRALTFVIIGLALVGTACSAGGVAGSSASPPPVAETKLDAAPRGAVALLSTDAGITAVEAGTTTERWSASGAVAAPDGSAVFARGSGTLLRLDPSTGEQIDSWPIDAALNPVLVAPDGRWVALTDQSSYDPTEPPAESTALVVVRGGSGTVRARWDLAGDIEPEAFSPDGSRVVVLDHRGSTYRVETVQLATGERSPTIDEQKNEVGDMAGRRVRGVLSADRKLLATLYQTPGDPQSGAFVHVLHLEGWTYCVGLPSAFGAGPDGSVTIERDGDDVVVISDHADQRARFSLTELVDVGSNAVPVHVTPGAGARADAPYRSVPGFRGLVAVIPTTASAPASPSSASAPG